MIQKKTYNGNILKWIFISLSFLFVGSIIYFYVLYAHIQGTENANFPETAEFVLAETDLVTIDETVFFQDNDSFHIVTGKDAADLEYVVYVRLLEDAMKIEAIYLEKDTISEASIMDIWSQDCSACTFKQAKNAMLDEQALWELTYIDDRNRYVMDYFNLFTGERYEQLRLHQN